MSVVTMVRLVQERQSQEDSAQQVTLRKAKSVTPTEEEQKGSEAKHAVTTALERLTGFIPTEVVAGWGAAVGLIGPTTALAGWVIFAVAVVFLVALLLLETALREKKSKIRTPGQRTLLMVIVAAVAFIIWAFATPGSPAATQWGTEITRYFGVAAIAVSALLPKLTQFLGLAPVE
jgi:uncharacterized membrane protein YecN with MAPEG domain